MEHNNACTCVPYRRVISCLPIFNCSCYGFVVVLFAVCSVVLNLSGVGRFIGKLSKWEMNDKENNAKEQEELWEEMHSINIR